MDIDSRHGRIVQEPAAVRLEDRHQILAAGQEIDVGFFPVTIFRQSFIGLPCDGRSRQRPAETEGTVARAGIVGEGELRTEAGTAGAGGQGHHHGARAGDRIGAEFLADAADRAAALGQGRSRQGGRAVRSPRSRLARTG